MRAIDILRISLSTFVHNKMRTLLTVFGIAIGIGTIVLLFSLGYGLQKVTIEEISTMKALSTYNVSTGNSGILKLNDETVKKISAIPGVESTDTSLSVSGQVKYDGSQTDLIANIASARFLDLESPRMDAGSLYASDSTKNIVITSTIAGAFNMAASDMINKKISLELVIPNPVNESAPTTFSDEYTVTGVIKDSSASYAYIPSGSVALPAGSDYTTVKAKVESQAKMSGVRGEVEKMGFQATSVGERITQMNKIFNNVQIFLIVFGAIALLVASIGMFNTLTISLLERTKDIGIMKALGATDKEIYLIFLTESTMISTAGGAIGVIGAFILGTIANVLISTLAGRYGGDPVKIFQAPVLFVGFILIFSIITGFLTGLYPSRRAGKLNPLDALRYE